MTRSIETSSVVCYEDDDHSIMEFPWVVPDLELWSSSAQVAIFMIICMHDRDVDYWCSMARWGLNLVKRQLLVAAAYSSLRVTIRLGLGGARPELATIFEA